MGILRTLFLITAPIAGLTYSAFRLGQKLPVASRLFGNYIGLSYVYFKSLLKLIKPVDKVPFQVLSLARKTSQQSQALRRELKGTLKRVQQQVKAKRQQTFQNMRDQLKQSFSDFSQLQPQPIKIRSGNSGSFVLLEIMKKRQDLLIQRQQKKRSQKFYQGL